jgi:hypothetical protein
MTTALTLITDAMAQANLAEQGQELSADEGALGLRYLNRLMGKWSQMRLLFPVPASYSVTLTGAGSYTIGPTGDVVGLRPIKVLSAYATDSGGTSYGVHLRTQDQWDAIAVKASTGGPPEQVYYEPSSTNGRVWVYPVATGYTLQLDALALLTSFASLSTDLTLPDGYEAAIVPTLADELCSSYGVQTPGDVLRRAAGAVRALKRTNSEPLLVQHDMAESGRETFRISRGY